MLGANEKPDVTYADVGGLDMQKQEIREAVELPLTHFDLYKQIGKGHVILPASRSTRLTILQVLTHLAVCCSTGHQEPVSNSTRIVHASISIAVEDANVLLANFDTLTR